MMRQRADLATLVYFVLHVLLLAAAWRWHSLAAAIAACITAVGVTNIAHNHSHLPIWRARTANRATDLALSLAMGVPAFVFKASHQGMHHRRMATGQDATEPRRTGSGTHLPGLLLHPLRVLPVVVPDILRVMHRAACRSRRMAGHLCAQCAVALALPLALLAAGRDGALYALLPQWFGLHVLLAANHLQHAGAQPRARLAHSRNFLGWVNLLWFNIGYHTAHHAAPRLHWSALPQAHARIAVDIPPALVEPSLHGWIWRGLVLAPLAARLCATRRTERG